MGTQVEELIFGSCETSAEASLPDRVKAARDQYLEAHAALDDDDPTDREAYELLERMFKDAGGLSPLPRFDTWTSYLRQWRRATDGQKKRPRAGRATGASVVRRDQVE
jgi:hypothetical protein